MSLEQRNAFRIPMPDGQKRAQLRIEGRTFDVQLVDASATGVALACPLTVALEIDDGCELLTSSGGGYIRIVRKEVFADGVLIGAVRTGDSPERSGLFSQLVDWLSWPVNSFLSSNPPVKIGLVIGFVALVGGAGCVACYRNWFHAPVAVTLPVVTPVELHGQTTAEDAQRALQQANDFLSSARPPLSASDQRALRILEQQKQLLVPETSRRLRLSPAQENQIERALKAAEAAGDTSHPEFWDTIRRTELQILRILTPAQAKSWRQLQSDT